MNKKRISAIGIGFVGALCVIGAVLFSISVTKHEEYSKKVASQRTFAVNVKNCRGKFYDRNMIPLVDSSLSQVVVENSELKYKDGRNLMIPSRYFENSTACHLIGYTDGEGSGVCGLEKTFDSWLTSGAYKKINVIRSADGSIIEEVGHGFEDTPVEGDSVVLTLDSHIQKICDDVLRNNRVTGGVVVMDVGTFDVLAMASSPAYDREHIENYIDSPNGELVNRCVSPYNGGSIFKVITMCCAIENGALEHVYFCPGKMSFGRVDFSCHKEEGHGLLSSDMALANSCNCAFYRMGAKLGSGKILTMAKKFGIGSGVVYCSDFDENPGNLPKKRKYSIFDSINYSIGQGEILITPLQVANMVSVIAAGGKSKKVNIGEKIIDYTGATGRIIREVGEKNVISPKTAETVGYSMRLAVTEGTASYLKNSPARIAGKTGTAETGWQKDGKNMVHGWFCGFFPYENPRYAMAVLVEDGGSGSLSAVPVFGEIAEEIIKFYPI